MVPVSGRESICNSPPSIRSRSRSVEKRDRRNREPSVDHRFHRPSARLQFLPARCFYPFDRRWRTDRASHRDRRVNPCALAPICRRETAATILVRSRVPYSSDTHVPDSAMDRAGKSPSRPSSRMARPNGKLTMSLVCRKRLSAETVEQHSHSLLRLGHFPRIQRFSEHVFGQNFLLQT